MLVLLWVLMEVALEDRMDKHFIPRHSILLMDLQASGQEILSFWPKRRRHDQWFHLDIPHQLELSMRSPRCLSMQHLIEDKSSCPNITLRRIRLRLQYLQRHIQRCSDWCSIFHSLRDVLFSESKVSNLHNSFTQHDIRWFEIST